MWAKKGQKAAFVGLEASKHVTMLPVVSADGKLLVMFFIIKGARLMKKFVDAWPEAVFIMTESGGIDNECWPSIIKTIAERKSFRICGIYPLDESVFTDADFAPSDARLGLSKASPEVAAARALGRAQSAEVVGRALALHLPDAREGLADAAAKAKEAREKAVGKSKGSFEERSVYTSELFHVKRVSMADTKAAEEARLDAVRAKRLENKAKKVEERAAIDERKAARAALKESKEAAAAARTAAPASAASSGKKRKRSEVEAGPESAAVRRKVTKKPRLPAAAPPDNMYKKTYVSKK